MLLGVWAILAGAISLVGFSWLLYFSFQDAKDPLIAEDKEDLPTQKLSAPVFEHH